LANIIHYSITGRNIRQYQEMWSCHKNVQIGNTPRGFPVETKWPTKKESHKNRQKERKPMN